MIFDQNALPHDKQPGSPSPRPASMTMCHAWGATTVLGSIELTELHRIYTDVCNELDIVPRMSGGVT